MANYQHFQTVEQEGVHILYLADPGPDRAVAMEMGRELMEFAQNSIPNQLLINFREIGALSAPVVAKLLMLIKQVQSRGGRVECCEGVEGFQDVLGMLGKSLPFTHVDKSEDEVLGILRNGR